MCLAIPGRVEQITEGDVRMGRVNFGGVVKNVCLDYVPEVVVGDYTIVHVGFALSRIDEETAEETLDLFEKMGLLKRNWPARKKSSPAPPVYDLRPAPMEAVSRPRRTLTKSIRLGVLYPNEVPH